MHAKFYIVDCQWHCHEVSLATKSHGYQCTALDAAAEEQITSSFRTNTIVLDGAELLLSNAHQFFSYNYVHPIQMYYLLKELEHWQRLRQKIVRFLRKLNGIVVLKVIPVDKGVLDLAWCRRATALTWRKVEEENLMSWLSTLGGAFSALGDCFQKCADKAGKISMYQLKIASGTGDPAVLARCRLYYSISLIQKGHLRTAKNLVLTQYALAKSDEMAGDDRLYKMCHGIWLKLQHAYHLRIAARVSFAATGETSGQRSQQH